MFQILLEVNIVLWDSIMILFISPKNAVKSLLLGYFSEQRLKGGLLIVDLWDKLCLDFHWDGFFWRI